MRLSKCFLSREWTTASLRSEGTTFHSRFTIARTHPHEWASLVSQQRHRFKEQVTELTIHFPWANWLKPMSDNSTRIYPWHFPNTAVKPASNWEGMWVILFNSCWANSSAQLQSLWAPSTQEGLCHPKQNYGAATYGCSKGGEVPQLHHPYCLKVDFNSSSSPVWSHLSLAKHQQL